MLPIVNTFKQFWLRHPALLYAVSMLIGISAAMNWNPILLVPFSLMLLPFFPQRRLLLVLGITIVSFFYVKTHYLFPKLPTEGVAGEAHLEISSLSSNTKHFGKQWVYKGTLRSFEGSDGNRGTNIPVSINIPNNQEIHRPTADKDYLLTGRLKEISPGHYIFKADKNAPWIPLNSSWSFAEWRFRAKQEVSSYIHNYFSNPKAATFLTGIATGDFDDRLMSFEFSRFGLQHIMAISGFHFAIIAAILSILLRSVMGRKKSVPLLIFLLSSYFVFLGCGASVMRAWAAIFVVLCGMFIKREGSGLNSLGVGMLIVLMIDPTLYNSIGFQFSFAVTAAILVFFPSIDYLMQQILKKRLLSEAVDMNLLNQHGYCILSFLRQAIALTAAVNLIALPMTLFFFQKFPLFSLLYNLFFPFLVSFSMLLLIVGILITFIFSPLGEAVHFANQTYTEFILNFVYNVPTSIDVSIRFSIFSTDFLICFLCLLFSAGVYIKSLLEEHQEANSGFAYL
jgi:competence protein ComEC